MTEASVHVWAASLEVSDERLAQLTCALSSEERGRASRFRSGDLTRHFIAGRGYLRELLGAYMGLPPADIRLAYDEHGKPRLAAPEQHRSLLFNVSHSGPLALYAVSAVARVGVDVERIEPFADMPAVAGRFFSPSEQRRLEAESPESYVLAFYRCWTRKEAYLKATGFGLLTPLDSFDVSLARGEPPAILRVDGDYDAPRRWALIHLEPARSCVGALAVETACPEVHCWQWC